MLKLISYVCYSEKTTRITSKSLLFILSIDTFCWMIQMNITIMTQLCDPHHSIFLLPCSDTVVSAVIVILVTITVFKAIIQPVVERRSLLAILHCLCMRWCFLCIRWLCLNLPQKWKPLHYAIKEIRWVSYL